MKDRRLAFFFASMLLGCAGGPGGGSTGGSLPSSLCVANVCADSSDCAMGARCNRQLKPPRCEMLYCGAEGTACDDNVLCAEGSTCILGVCSSGAKIGDACGSTTFGNLACESGLYCVRTAGSCNSACQSTPAQPKGTGEECAANSECSSLVCNLAGNCAGSCAAPPKPYPAGPYGFTQGSTIANLTFSGKIDPGGPGGSANYSSLALGDISLADYHNDPTVKYLVLMGEAGWCAPCKTQQASVPGWQASYDARGVRFLEVLMEGAQPGDSASESTLNAWAGTYHLHVGVAIDPQASLQSLVDPSSSPSSIIIQASTMKILSMEVGTVDLSARLSNLP